MTVAVLIDRSGRAAELADLLDGVAARMDSVEPVLTDSISRTVLPAFGETSEAMASNSVRTSRHGVLVRWSDAACGRTLVNVDMRIPYGGSTEPGGSAQDRLRSIAELCRSAPTEDPSTWTARREAIARLVRHAAAGVAAVDPAGSDGSWILTLPHPWYDLFAMAPVDGCGARYAEHGNDRLHPGLARLARSLPAPHALVSMSETMKAGVESVQWTIEADRTAMVRPSEDVETLRTLSEWREDNDGLPVWREWG